MRRFEGVIFDMDGTLVEPLLDFEAIREELGIAPGEGIIEGIEAMDPPRRDEAAPACWTTSCRPHEGHPPCRAPPRSSGTSAGRDCRWRC